MYHPPTTLPPLQVDVGQPGSDSDHNIVVFAPQSDLNFKVKRMKKSLKVRPLPGSQIYKFENELINCDWTQVLNSTKVDEKV